jgi:caa(3)-type oxidase subunit IV
MAAAEHHGPRNAVIWIYLVILAALSVAASIIFPAPLDTVVIFILAFAKAILVLLYFMHLRVENIFVHSLFYVPLLLVVVMFFGFLPDIMWSLY